MALRQRGSQFSGLGGPDLSGPTGKFSFFLVSFRNSCNQSGQCLEGLRLVAEKDIRL